MIEQLGCKRMTSYTVDDILKRFDETGFAVFPSPNANFDIAAIRLTGFRSDNFWALFIEELVNWVAVDGIMRLTHAVGSSFEVELGHPSPYFEVDYRDDPAEIAYKNWIPPKVVAIEIRGEIVKVNSSDVERISGCGFDFDLLIHLLPSYRHKMYSTDSELFRYMPNIPVGITKVIQLDDWYYEDMTHYGDGYVTDKPSKTEVFQMIAQVLATGDPSYYQPTFEPNIHWKLLMN